MTGLTVVTLLVILAALATRFGYPRALAVGGATPAGAALTVGDTSIPTFYAMALGAAALLAWGLLSRHQEGSSDRPPLPPGIVRLWIFFGWSVIVTLSAPLMFDGLLLVHPETSQLVAGTITPSNIAQITYLFLGICVVLFLALSPQTHPSLLGLTLGITVLLSLARHLALTFDLPFPELFFDNSPAFVYIETAAGGVERVRGILSEPAALATTCVTSIAYFTARGLQARGMRRIGCGVLIGSASYLGIVSTSTTFIVAGAVCGLTYLLVLATSFTVRRSTMSTAVGLGAATGIIVVALSAPTVVGFVRTALADKLSSGSFAARSTVNTQSFEIFLDTYGWGVGLGSARSSSALLTLLSAVGLIGAILAVAAVVTIVRGGWRDASCQPVLYCLTAHLITQVTSGADLSDPTGVVWISFGILTHSWLRTAPHVERPSERATS